MIARLWSARATPQHYPAYAKHFSENVLPELRAVDGYVSVKLLMRASDNAVEILVITCWRSFAAIDAFAGADREAAVVADAAAALLTSFDRRVRHYEVAATDDLT
jgi:heme-degrading monooxygenase HmoA